MPRLGEDARMAITEPAQIHDAVVERPRSWQANGR
jgi:hypothetical protein